MSPFNANVTRGDTFWLVHVPEIGRTTQARSLREVEPMARDLVAAMLDDVDPADVELEVVVEVPAGAAGHWNRSAELHAESAELRRRAAEEAGAAARALRALGLTVRDIGAVLDVSYQRADQLLRQGSPTPPSGEPVVNQR